MSKDARFRAFGWAVLGLLLLSALSYVGFIRGSASGGSSPGIVKSPPGAKTPVPAEGRGSSTARGDLIHGDKDRLLRSRFFALLAKHRRESWVSCRSLGVPFWGNPEMSAFFKVLKEEFGPDCAPLLTALFAEAQSPYYREFYLTLLVGIEDCAAEAKLRSIALSPGDDRLCQELAIYGLGFLGTDSAWQTVLEIRAKCEQDLTDPKYTGVLAAMVAAGKKGADSLIQECLDLAARGRPDKARYYMAQLRGADTDTLAKIAQESPFEEVKKGAALALIRDFKSDPGRLQILFDLATRNTDSELRDDVVGNLTRWIGFGYIDLTRFPEVHSRMIAMYPSLPLELQLVLRSAPGGDQLPGSIDQLVPDFSRLTSWRERGAFTHALASDPAGHARLAEVLAGSQSGIESFFALNSLKSHHLGITDPKLAAALVGLATDRSQDGQYALWRLLGQAPPEAQEKALEQVSQSYFDEPLEEGRLQLIQRVQNLGEAAAPFSLSLLESESFPQARIQLACAILWSGSPQQDPALAARLKAAFAPDMARLLDGQDPAGIQFAASNPGGVEGYAALVRDLFSLYGTSGQEEEIRSFADRMYLPGDLVGNDPVKEASYRKRVREVVTQSIDEIRSRDNN